MKLGVLTVPLYDDTLEQALSYLSALGVQAVELGVGGFPGTAHANARELIAQPAQVKQLRELVSRYHMEISILSVHGNPVHPNAELAAKDHADFEAAVQLANLLEIPRVATFSGCPGDHPGGRYPNWVTCPWPEDFLHILDYQWNDVLIPYWTKASALAQTYGVTEIALEMHPGFCVYNPETLLRLRKAIGSCIGANFDPSHLFWQGVDPALAIKTLKDCIFHVHAKDCRVDPYNAAQNGVLDTKHYGDEMNRSWVFRTVGYGHGPDVWRDIFSALSLIGYNHVVSIEHEDSYMTAREGLEKAVSFLQRMMIQDPKPSGLFWA